MRSKYSIVVLVSGSGSNLQALIDACTEGQIDGEINAVISNKPGVYGLQRAEKHGITTQALEHQHFNSREDFDKNLINVIDRYNPDLVVLAGFMRILSAGFVNHYDGRLLNIHPSLLPAYKGLNTHQRALDGEAKYHGASVHFVSAGLDDGPVIMQARVPVKADDDASSLATRVLAKEHIIYPQVVEWFCAGRLKLKDHRIWLDNQLLQTPVILGD
ncbi:MAG: phosphoribosylglycinamide formyltransferase [Thiolinea sp.]